MLAARQASALHRQTADVRRRGPVRIAPSSRTTRRCIILNSVALGGASFGDDAYNTRPLPDLKDTYLTPKAAQELGSVLVQSPARKAFADFYYPQPAAAAAAAGRRGAIIFGHAFVQPSYSYKSVIKKLREAGWLVVAPTTDLFDVIGRDVGVKFDQKRADVKLQSTLQSALIIDMLRAHQLLLDEGKVDDIIFVGHSLGAACSIIAAAKVKDENIRGVAVMSPEVREMQKTPVNDDIWMLNGDEESIKAAMSFFKDEFPRDTPLALISSRRDKIATPDDIRRLFVVATESRQNEDVALFSISGNHIGYENELDLPNRINFDGASLTLPLTNIKLDLGPLDGPLKALVNLVNGTIVKAFELLQYRAYWLSPLLGNSKLQEPENIAVLSKTLQHMLMRKTLASLNISISAVGSNIAMDVQPTKTDVARVLKNEPRDNTTPTPWLDRLLVSYAGVQAINSITAFNLLLQSDGDFETKLGLVILATLCTNLVYENALLAAGRAIGTKGPDGMQLLQELSKWRFLAHSGAPLVLVTGLNMAGRAGVTWATNPTYEGLIGLAILTVVTISSIRNSFFLEITPRWNRGILRYSYNQGAADFTRIIPVILTTATLIVLGWQAYQQDSALLPFFVGPLVAFLLNAAPSAKDGEVSNKLPQFVLGNGGEVVLFASLVITEVLLQTQGR